MAKVLDVIWGAWEPKYFSENQKYDSTALETASSGQNIAMSGGLVAIIFTACTAVISAKAVNQYTPTPASTGSASRQSYRIWNFQ
jgi:hypothetical protein